MDLTDATEERYALGIRLLLEGQCIDYHGVRFSLAQDKTLNVDSYSAWGSHPTEAHVVQTIVRSKAVLRELLERSGGSWNYLTSLRPVFTLCEDLGKGSVALACELDGQVTLLRQ